MIRPYCARSCLWSDPSALEEVMIRPKCARIRQWSDFSGQIDLWSDHHQTIVRTAVLSNFRPDPVISVWEHTGVRWTGSDHKPIWVWTSTWDIPKGTLFNQTFSGRYGSERGRKININYNTFVAKRCGVFVAIFLLCFCYKPSGTHVEENGHSGQLWLQNDRELW